MNDDRDPRDPDGDARLVTGSYALDALSESERAEFERAAAASESLRDEVDGFRATATVLGLAAAPVQPSAGLKGDLMAKLAMTPQLPADDDDETRSTETRSSVATASEAVASEAPSSETVAAGAPVRAAGAAERSARVRWFQRPASVIAAVAAAAALFVGGGFVGSVIAGSGSQDGGAAVEASAAQLAEITAAADVQRKTVEMDDGGAATLVWSNDLGRSALLADGLSALPDGKVYEAWYISTDGALPAGTFTAAAAGTSWHVLDGTMSAGDAVGVTIEPAGGSDTPTSTPIMVVQPA